jgi:hypothetical protein
MTGDDPFRQGFLQGVDRIALVQRAKRRRACKRARLRLVDRMTACAIVARQTAALVNIRCGGGGDVQRPADQQGCNRQRTDKAGLSARASSGNGHGTNISAPHAASIDASQRGEVPASRSSNLRLAAEFDYAARWNAEEVGCGHRVAMHELKQTAAEMAEP